MTPRRRAGIGLATSMSFGAMSFSAISLSAMSPGAAAAEAHRTSFGTLINGTRIEAVELHNANGISVRIITLGATIQSLITPDRNGHPGDIALGYDRLEDYERNPRFFNVTVGRYANRIAGGRFTLDGHAYQLAVNSASNHLHGGAHGFDKAVWTIDSVESSDDAGAVLSYVSPDGEEGYPGTLKVKASFRLNSNNELAIEYTAVTDKPTIVNLTNHGYLNLAADAGGSVLDQRLSINADRYTPVNAALIPTGERASVEGTPFDFRTPTRIGLRIRDGSNEQILFGHGYDHNFIINGAPGTLRQAARLEDPVSGRVLDLFATAPGLQVYSGNNFDGTLVGKGGRVYRQSDSLSLEPEFFPDTPNHPDFPSARLAPGEVYSNRIVYRFSVLK